jgi:hypothetical protein
MEREVEILYTRIKKAPRVYFHVETLYYRFMDVFIKKIIVSINPSCMQNFINVQLVNRLQVPDKEYSKHTG